MLEASRFELEHNPRTPRYLPLSYYFGAPARRARRFPYVLAGTAAVLSLAALYMVPRLVL